MKKYVLSCLAMVGTLIAETQGNIMGELSEIDKAVIDEVVGVFGISSNEEIFGQAENLLPVMLHLMSVPPLKTMAYVVSNHQLKAHLQEAKSDLLKWQIFMGGFEKKMAEEKAKEDFWHDLKLFAAQTHLNNHVLREFAEANRWNDFVSYVLED